MIAVSITAPAGNGMGGGTHLVLKTDTGTFDVHVGPSRWLSQQKYAFSQNDRIEVTGARETINDTDSIVAREIKRDGQTMTLRSADGRPLWSGGMRH
jgi:hypothetical protein